MSNSYTNTINQVSDALVFFYGINIQYKEVTVTFSRNGAATAQIYVTPHENLELIMRFTPVHIFVRDPIPRTDGEYNNDQYILYFEGFYTGYTAGIAANAANYVLECISSLGAIQFASPVVAHIENYGPLPVFGGKMPQEVIDLTLGSPLMLVNFQGSSLHENFLRNLTQLTTFNNLALLFLNKVQLCNKLYTFQSDFVEKILSLAAASDLITREASTRSGDDAFSIMYSVLTRLFCYIFQAPIPTKPKRADNRTAFSSPEVRKYFKNVHISYQYFLVPDTFSAFPPSCNIIHPTQLSSMPKSRDYVSIPTRKAAVTTSGLASGILVVSPRDLISGRLSNLTGNTYYSSIANPIELLSGVRPGMGSNALYELMALVAGATPTANNESTDQSKLDFYTALQDMLDFTRIRDARTLDTTVEVQGNIWAVPGFPILIADYKSPIYGMLESSTTNIKSSGAMSVSLHVVDGMILSNRLENNIVDSKMRDVYDKLLVKEKETPTAWNKTLANASQAQVAYKEANLSSEASTSLYSADSSDFFKALVYMSDSVLKMNDQSFIRTINARTNPVTLKDVFPSCPQGKVTDMALSSSGLASLDWFVNESTDEGIIEIINDVVKDFPDYEKIPNLLRYLVMLYRDAVRDNYVIKLNNPEVPDGSRP